MIQGLAAAEAGLRHLSSKFEVAEARRRAGLVNDKAADTGKQDRRSNRP